MTDLARLISTASWPQPWPASAVTMERPLQPEAGGQGGGGMMGFPRCDGQDNDRTVAKTKATFGVPAYIVRVWRGNLLGWYLSGCTAKDPETEVCDGGQRLRWTVDERCSVLARTTAARNENRLGSWVECPPATEVTARTMTAMAKRMRICIAPVYRSAPRGMKSVWEASGEIVRPPCLPRKCVAMISTTTAMATPTKTAPVPRGKHDPAPMISGPAFVVPSHVDPTAPGLMRRPGRHAGDSTR